MAKTDYKAAKAMGRGRRMGDPVWSPFPFSFYLSPFPHTFQIKKCVS